MHAFRIKETELPPRFEMAMLVARLQPQYRELYAAAATNTTHPANKSAINPRVPLLQETHSKSQEAGHLNGKVNNAQGEW